ncbi:UNVERIFIED_CONTAM: hypothetical protein Slati_2899600 [Sesamum latifolium]|uniref:Uncharacterized protein n=1 Tax=Sesamum latifolium TaxID=2727402 RepID=A0AAW2VDS0_9LAMI
MGKRPRNDFILWWTASPHIKEGLIRTVLQSPIGNSLCSRAVRAPACRPASPSRPHVLHKSQPTVLSKERPVTPGLIVSLGLVSASFLT